MKKITLFSLLLAAGITTNAQIHYSEDFSGATNNALPTNMTSIDDDGDQEEWFTYDVGDAQGLHATSASWSNGTILNPDNWMITPAIDLTNASGTISLEWVAKAQDPDWTAENYTVYVSTGNTINDFMGSSTTFNEIIGNTNELWVSRSLDVSSFAGQTIYIAFRHHNVSDQFRLNIDDIMVRTLLADDAAVSDLSFINYELTNTNVNITGTIQNWGSNTITALDLKWSDGVNTYTDNLTGLSISSMGTYNFTHSVPFNSANVDNYPIDVWVELAGDQNNDNDTMSSFIATLSFMPTAHVVIEEGTGTWCGWCPRGAVAMGNLTASQGSNGFIGIAVHNGDPMTVTAYDNGANFGGYPSMNVDRVILDEGVSQAAMLSFFNERKAVTRMVDVSFTQNNLDYWTRELSLTINGHFATNLSGNYRFAVVLVEDGVTGTSGGYNQTNYYAGGAYGNMGGYESLPDPVPAAQMVYDHVGRALIGGYNGQAGSIPATITAGDNHNYTFNYTVPSTMDPYNLKVVGLVIDASTGEILNAVEEDVAVTVGIEENNNFTSQIYPNPTTDLTNLHLNLLEDGELKVEVLNMMGQVVKTNYQANIPAGEYYYQIDLSNQAEGMYFINITVNGKTHIEKVNVLK